MLKVLTNLTKAAVAVAVSPVAAAVDVVMIPVDACEPDRGAFSRTGRVLAAAGECVAEAIAPVKDGE